MELNIKISMQPSDVERISTMNTKSSLKQEKWSTATIEENGEPLVILFPEEE